VILRDPAIHSEKPHGQATGIKADSDQVTEGTVYSDSAINMEMAMLPIASMAMVIALGSTGGIN